MDEFPTTQEKDFLTLVRVEPGTATVIRHISKSRCREIQKGKNAFLIPPPPPHLWAYQSIVCCSSLPQRLPELRRRTRTERAGIMGRGKKAKFPSLPSTYEGILTRSPFSSPVLQYIHCSPSPLEKPQGTSAEERGFAALNTVELKLC